MIYTAKVTSKGQITIPGQVREALQIQQGDIVYFDIVSKKDKKALITSQSVQDTIDSLYGSLSDGKTPYVPMEKVREEAGKLLGEKYKVK